MSPPRAARTIHGRSRTGSAPRAGSTGERPAAAAAAQPIDRAQLLARLRDDTVWDAVIIGGGATGLGIAVDAAARGLRVALIEAQDFAAGTSSRSTKLVHGGVRYLAQGNVKLVREALAERATLLEIAPHIVRPLEFVVPCYDRFERPVLRLGLGLYDMLAGQPQRRADALVVARGNAHPAAWRARRGPARRRVLLGRPVRRCAHGDRPDADRLLARRCPDQLCALHRAAARHRAASRRCSPRMSRPASRCGCARAACSTPRACGSTASG